MEGDGVQRDGSLKLDLKVWSGRPLLNFDNRGELVGDFRFVVLGQAVKSGPRVRELTVRRGAPTTNWRRRALEWP